MGFSNLLLMKGLSFARSGLVRRKPACLRF